MEFPDLETEEIFDSVTTTLLIFILSFHRDILFLSRVPVNLTTVLFAVFVLCTRYSFYVVLKRLYDYCASLCPPPKKSIINL